MLHRDFFIDLKQQKNPGKYKDTHQPLNLVCFVKETLNPLAECVKKKRNIVSTSVPRYSDEYT